MTREEIIALARECGANSYKNRHYCETYMTFSPEKLEAFFHAAQKLEREACAKLCDPAALGIEQGDDGSTGVYRVEKAIRKRSK